MPIASPRQIVAALAWLVAPVSLAGQGASVVPPLGRLPEVPRATGPLQLSVVYPDSNSVVAVRDSSFLFGSTGDGTAVLLINGVRVPVAPNGAWLAWLPFRGDSVAEFRIIARTATDSASLDYRVRLAPRFVPADPSRLWVDTTSFQPAGRVWWPGTEFLTLAVRAAEGAAVSLLLPDGRRVPFAEATDPVDPVPTGVRAFDRDTLNLRVSASRTWYRASVRGLAAGDPGPLFGPRENGGSGGLRLEAVRGPDTLRLDWPLRLGLLDTVPILARLDDDPGNRGGTDRITVGRAWPAATYTWFFPTGTVARVTGRRNDDLRVALSSGSSAWVSQAEAFPALGAAPGPAVVGSLTLTPLPDRVAVRIPVGSRTPFQVQEAERSLTLLLYHAVSDLNWVRYGGEDSLVALVTSDQASADELRIRFDLGLPVWGYRTRWDGSDLILEIRRPPVIDPQAPLRGRLIAVDAGHPPLGSTGPTGLKEPEANLAIALLVRELLEARGARVIMPRTTPAPVDLWPRVRFADSADADLLVSIHNNALPDGVNPFSNNGSSTFYNHPRALPLARDILGRLVARFGVPDLGVGRGDLALARPTWMPAVLTEGLFLIVPEQEAALRSDAGRLQYALAVVEGLERFLASRASAPGSR